MKYKKDFLEFKHNFAGKCDGDHLYDFEIGWEACETALIPKIEGLESIILETIKALNERDFDSEKGYESSLDKALKILRSRFK